MWRLASPDSPVTCFQGWDGKVEELLQTKQAPYLFGLGMDGFVKNLRIWNLDKLDKSGKPVLVRCARLTKPNSQAEPVSLAVSDNLQLLAVAFDDGGIVLHRQGNILLKNGKEKTSFKFFFNL